MKSGTINLKQKQFQASSSELDQNRQVITPLSLQADHRYIFES